MQTHLNVFEKFAFLNKDKAGQKKGTRVRITLNIETSQLQWIVLANEGFPWILPNQWFDLSDFVFYTETKLGKLLFE
jgi:hypothetical protein